jgi:hypothetical protein
LLDLVTWLKLAHCLAADALATFLTAEQDDLDWEPAWLLPRLSCVKPVPDDDAVIFNSYVLKSVVFGSLYEFFSNFIVKFDDVPLGDTKILMFPGLADATNLVLFRTSRNLGTLQTSSTVHGQPCTHHDLLDLSSAHLTILAWRIGRTMP